MTKVELAKTPEEKAHAEFFKKFYDSSLEEVRDRLIHVLHTHKIWKVEGAYSGGHDEGGLDELQAWDKDGNEVDVGSWGSEVFDACNMVLTTKFFSWALGASVYGSFHVDMSQRRVWTEGSIEEYVEDKTPIDWPL